MSVRLPLDRRGAGNLKAIVAAGLTAGIMYAVLDIRGFRKPEWLKKPPIPDVNIQAPLEILDSVKRGIDEARRKVAGSPPPASALSDADRAAVEKFLDSEEAGKLVPKPPSQYAGSWYFLKPEWVDRDILRAPYEDGHRRGVMLLKVESVKDGRPTFKILMDSQG